MTAIRSQGCPNQANERLIRCSPTVFLKLARLFEYYIILPWNRNRVLPEDGIDTSIEGSLYIPLTHQDG